MTSLKEIAENIKKRNLNQALELCDLYGNKKDEHIIYNFKGVIHLLKDNLDLAETNFLNSIKVKRNFEDPIKNLYLIYIKKI